MQNTIILHQSRRLFALLLVFLLLGSAAVFPVSAANDPVSITTAEEFLAITDAPDGDYVLAADLDFAGIEYVPFPFSGTFDGNGHLLLNLTVDSPAEETGITYDGNDIEYETVFGGLFSVLTEAEIHDLTLVNPRIVIDTEENCFIGSLAGTMENSVIRDVQVINGYISLTQTAYNSGTAGLVGFGSGSFQDCSFEGTLIFADTNREENCESFLGGICATGMVDVTGCTVTLDAYASVCGYAHSGGLVGMFYDPEWLYTGTYTENTVSGRILFYEYNPTDRRAYCEAFVGEELGSVELSDNTDTDYHSEETDETDGILLPETHAPAEYTAEVISPTCTECGYTEYTCTADGCGYTYRDDYTLPAHVPGEAEIMLEATETEEGLAHISCSICGEFLSRETLPVHVRGDWMMVEAPSFESEGTMCLYCAECGMVMETQTVAALAYVESCTIDPKEITLRYRKSGKLTAEISPEYAAIPTVSWSSSDPSVVTVDENGVLTPVGRGTATVTCASDDGAAEDTCTVTVKFAWWQWIIWTILFGFLWY